MKEEEMLLEGLLKYFSKIEKRLIENILWVVEAMITSFKAGDISLTEQYPF